MHKFLSIRFYAAVVVLVAITLSSWHSYGQCMTPSIEASGTSICNQASQLIAKYGQQGSSFPNGTTFAWYKDGVEIDDATEQYLVISPAQGGSGNYHAYVSVPLCGISITNDISVIDETPDATILPAGSTSICSVGGSVNLYHEMANGSYTYKWRLNGVIIQGAFQSSYSASVAGTYRVDVKNGTCTVESNPIVVTSSSINNTVTPSGPLVACSGLVLGAVSGYSNYVWYRSNQIVAGSLTTPNPNLYNYTVVSEGQYKVRIYSGDCFVTSDAVSVTAPAATFVQSTPSVCANQNAYFETQGDNTNYVWTVDGGTIVSGGGTSNASLTVKWLTNGTKTVTVKYTTPQGCQMTVASTQVSVSTPPTATITAVNTLGINFAGEPTLLEIVATSGATSFDWLEEESTGPGEPTFASAGGTVPYQKARVSVPVEGEYQLKVVPVNNGCAGTTPFVVPFTAISPAKKFTEIKLFHPELLPASSGSVENYLYLPKHSAGQPNCYSELGPVTLRVILDEGDVYNLGKNPFTASVHVIVKTFADIPGNSQEWQFSLNVNEAAPEQMFEKRITIDPGLIKFIKVTVDDYSSSNPAVANVIRFRAQTEEEDIVNVSTVAISSLNANSNAADPKWEQTFSWVTSCPSVTDYVFQIIKKQGDDVLNLSDPEVWKKGALQIQTESPERSLTLSMAEGSGTYFWRVIPLGNRKNGMGDRANWGSPSAYAQLNYTHPEDKPDDSPQNKNWIYSRTFTEGNRVSEKIVYANGLQQVAQQQTKIKSDIDSDGDEDNVIVASQTIQDFIGRNALSSLPIPVAGVAALGYVNKLLTKSGTESAYSAADFDGLAVPSPARDKGDYYGGFLAPNAYNDGVASAESYPFTQTVFSSDNTGRVKEQAGVGLTHSKAGGKTVRTFYSHPLEGELVSLFGMEAPDPKSVQKITTFDANGTASVSYQTKDGKVIATALSLTGSTGPLTQLTNPAPAAASFSETIKNNQRVNDFTVVSRTPLFAVKDETLTMNYELTPTQLKELCSSANDLIGYWPLESNTNDVSQLGNHALLSNAVPTPDAFNRTGGAYYWNGNNAMMSVVDDGDFDFGADDFTVSIWANKVQNSVNYRHTGGINKWADFTAGSDQNEWALELGNGPGDNLPTFLISSGTNIYRAVSADPMALNTWYHIVGVRKGNELRIYVNGVLKGTQTIPAGTVVNNAGRNIIIGKVGANPTQGRFDDVQIYRRGIDQAEVDQLRNRSTICKTCDYKVEFKLFKEDDPNFAPTLPSTVIQAGECTQANSLKYTTPLNFQFTISGGVNYVLEKRITLNNKPTATDPLYIDANLAALEQYHRANIQTRLNAIDNYLAANDLPGLYNYVDDFATYDAVNKRYVFPLLPTGTTGCQEYLFVPKIEDCNASEFSYSPTCNGRKMTGETEFQSFEDYFLSYYTTRNNEDEDVSNDVAIVENGKLRYMYFTHQRLIAEEKKLYFNVGQFDTMMDNLLAAINGKIPCDVIWNIWQREVIAYESYLKMQLSASGLDGQDGQDYADDLQNFSSVTSKEYSLLESFMAALDAELNDDVKDPEVQNNVCVPGNFIPKTTLYGQIGTQLIEPDLNYAYAMVYYNSGVINMKNALRFYAHITGTVQSPPAEPVLSDFTSLSVCDKYRFSKSTNMGDQGLTETDDEEVEERIQEEIQKVRGKCGQACDGRKEEFRQAIIQSLFSQNPSTVIQHYNVYLDNLFQNNKYVGVFDELKNNTIYTLSQCDLDAMVQALVENCRNTYCNTALTPHTEIDETGGREDAVTVYGTTEEWERLKMPGLYDFDLQVNSSPQTCNAGWDNIGAVPGGANGTKVLLEHNGNLLGEIYVQTDPNGNHYVITPVQDSNGGVALKNQSGQTIYIVNQDNVNDFLIVKFNPQGTPIWWKQFVVTADNPNGRAGRSSASQSTSAEPSFIISASGGIIFHFNSGHADYTVNLDGQELRTLHTNDDFIGKMDSNGNLLWHSSDEYLSNYGAYFASEDSQGNIYLSGHLSGVVTKHNASGVFQWKSSAVTMTGGGIGAINFTRFFANPDGSTYLFYPRVDYQSNIQIRLNGSTIETLNSDIAALIIKYKPDGTYDWHQAYELTDDTYFLDSEFTPANGSIFFTYTKSFVNELKNINEFGINYTGLSNQLLYTEIGLNKTVIASGVYSHSAPIDYVGARNSDNTFDHFLLQNFASATGYMISFNKASKTFENKGTEPHYASSYPTTFTNVPVSVVTKNNVDLGVVLSTVKPFTVNGQQQNGFSTFSRMLLRVVEDESCGHPQMCFQFTSSRIQPIVAAPGIPIYEPEPIPCEQVSASTLHNTIHQQVEQIIASRVTQFKEQYYSTCSDPAMLLEKFTLSRQEGLYHFTLYYYDRAGNLIRTVPPEGVVRLPAGNEGQIASSRALPTTHTMVTEYRYNTLKQLIREHSPDGNYEVEFPDDYIRPTTTDEPTLNASKYYSTTIYNDKSQIRFSRNAKQKKEGTYSYTKYDALGRIIEVGEGTQFDEVSMLAKRNEFGANSYPTSDVRFITRTFYDETYSSLPDGYLQEENNLRNRISHIYTDKDGLEISVPDDRVRTIYNYDPHGNVSWLIQSIPGMPPVAIEYEYDLISKKILQVNYNPSSAEFQHQDEFYHRYTYDGNSRIVGVKTSKDGSLWETEANYAYFLHGPLKRMVMGEDLVQGLDYTYTVQGWQKGINHPLLDKTSDPGGDALNSSEVGRDVFGLGARYFLGDYIFAGSSFEDAVLANIRPISGKSLYNGNISALATNTLNAPVSFAGVFGHQFTYDVLSRLLTSTAQTYNGTSFVATTPSAAYSNSYTYLGNGNIKTSLTYGSLLSGDLNSYLDNLTYYYTPGTNRLSYVSDAFTTPTPFTSDLESGQTANNYRYDAIGNLLQDDQQGTTITWNSNGKVEKVINDNQAKTEFMYDAAGDRIAKKQTNSTGLLTTSNFYVRDAGGNIMAVYEKKEQNGIEPEVVLTEMVLYGSDRLGVYTKSVSLNENEQTSLEAGEVRITQNLAQFQYDNVSYLVNPARELTLVPGFSYVSIGATESFSVRIAKTESQTFPEVHTRTLDSREYEMHDHLGNIRALITDIKLSTLSSDVPTDYRPELMAANNYYPFGLDMPGRSWPVGDKYRYGFNGKEKDMNGEWGTSTNYDYGFRIYNPSLGKFLSVDPLSKDYPWYTPYQFAGNMPINCIDLDGLEPVDVTFYASSRRPYPKIKPSEWYVVRNKSEEASYGSAFRYNIENNNPGAYQTISARNEWYKWAAKETEPKDNYWFAAADKVTSWWAVGAADMINAHWMKDPAEKLLRAANAFLLAENLINFGKYALGDGPISWVNPITNQKEIFNDLSGTALDNQMVVIEMTTLQKNFLEPYKESYIKENGQDAWDDLEENISDLFESTFLKVTASTFGADNDANNYAQDEFHKKYGDDTKFDFMNLEHRIFQGQKMAEFLKNRAKKKE